MLGHCENTVTIFCDCCVRGRINGYSVATLAAWPQGHDQVRSSYAVLTAKAGCRLIGSSHFAAGREARPFFDEIATRGHELHAAMVTFIGLKRVEIRDM